MPSRSIAVAHADDSEVHVAWARFLAESLSLDGHEVRLMRWATEPPNFAGLSMVVVLCTPQAREQLEQGLDAAPHDLPCVPVLREGEPDHAIPSQVRDRAYFDLRDETPGSAELLRLWRVLAGESGLDERPGAAILERHLTDVARVEGAEAAGWAAVAWADDAHAESDFATEWVLRRIAAEQLRGADGPEALVQARRGLAAALVADSARGIDLHEALVAALGG